MVSSILLLGIQIMAMSYVPDIFFKGDRPFLFALRDASSTLFLGRITELWIFHQLHRTLE